MEEDLDFSTDLVSDDSFEDISVDEPVELLDSEDNDISDYESSDNTETEILDTSDFDDEALSSESQSDEEEIETLDFENADMLSNAETDEADDENRELFDEALIDNTVQDIPFVEANYEDTDEISFSDLESSDAINENLLDDRVLTTNDFDEMPDETEDISFESDELPELELNDSTVNEFDDDFTEDTYPLDEQSTTSDDELGNFVNWENEYGDQIQDIQNDSSLTDDEKSVLLSSAYNDFTSGGDTLYSDADLDTDPGVAKTLTNNPNTEQQINSYNDIGLNDATDNVTDINDWLGDINPNYDEWDPDSPYSNNCGSCAYAVWKRLEGDNEICATADNIGYNDEMEALTGMEQVSMLPEEIESNLLGQGDGAHAIIGIDRANGAPGHWFNAVCMGGKVVAVDGQSGEILDWPPDYGEDVVNWEMSVKKG